MVFTLKIIKIIIINSIKNSGTIITKCNNLYSNNIIFESERDNYDGKSSNEKERIVSGIFGIEHEKPPSKYLRANAKKHGSEPAKYQKEYSKKDM